jgi:hypothetical protein
MTASGRPWFLSLGNWGDMFAAAGNVLAHDEFRPPARIVHYGLDPHIPLFLRSQPWVGEVYWQRPSCASEYRQVVQALCERPPPRHDFDLAAATIWPERRELRCTHVSLACKRSPVINRWSCPALPRDALQWAGGLPWDRQTLNILLHPYSLALTRREQHWPHWQPAIAWLLRQTPYRYYLTGVSPEGFFEFDRLTATRRGAVGGVSRRRFALPCGSRLKLNDSPRLVNLSNQTASQLEVLALALRCDGIITTSNNLSMWSVMTGTPALVCLTSVLRRREDYFRRWIEHPPNVLLERSHSLAHFKRRFERWVAGLAQRASDGRRDANDK